jgi:ribosome biogenesis GTPase
MNLKALGWSEAFETPAEGTENLARIIAVHRSHLRGVTVTGNINIHYSGDYTQDPVAVGDWIVMRDPFVDGQNKSAAIIKELVPRKSKIARIAAGDHIKEQVIAANIDIVFIVTSINQDFNLNRLQRYLFLIRQGLARPVILLSKTDLESSYDKIIQDLSDKIDGDVLIIPTSVITEKGVDQVKDLIAEGCTSVFVGSSGVGKSSLVNFLLGSQVQAVKEVRDDDDKGKHTTTSRKLFFIPDGGMIIDTPGIRGVSVFGSEEVLSDKFEQIEELMTKCKFSNCSHTTDPGCAIVEALKSGGLDTTQWENYLKLSAETAFNNNKLNKQAANTSNKKRKKPEKAFKSRKNFKKDN